MCKDVVDFFLTHLHTISFSLFLTTSLLEFHASHMHDSGSDLVDVILFLLGEAKNVEGLLDGREEEN